MVVPGPITIYIFYVLNPVENIHNICKPVNQPKLLSGKNNVQITTYISKFKYSQGAVASCFVIFLPKLKNIHVGCLVEWFFLHIDSFGLV